MKAGTRVSTRALLALAAFAAGVSTPASVVLAAPGGLPEAARCAGVWVVVDYGSLGGGTNTRCATSFSSGITALRSAGFAPTVMDGFLTRISHKPANPDPSRAYWGYWHATQQPNGSYSDWSYATQGAATYRPKPGVAEGWRYVSINASSSPPGALPPATDPNEPAPAPAPKKASTRPAAKPTKTPATSKSPAGTSPSETRPTESAAKRTATATKQMSSVPASMGELTPSEASSTAAAPPDPDIGSPVGTIVAGSAVVLAAAGLGTWWMLRGRSR